MALTKAKGHILADDLALGGNPTTSTQSASDNSTKIATTAYVTTAVANLVDGAPSTLNTLNEIAAALNDDAALNTTLTNSIATKLPLAGGTMSGALNMGSQNITGANRLTLADGITDTGQAGSATVFNESGSTADFRIESDSNTHMFFLDAGQNSIGINQGSPSSSYSLDVGGQIRSSGNAPAFNLREDDSSNQHWQIGSYGGVFALRNVTGSLYPFQINSAGNVSFGVGGAPSDVNTGYSLISVGESTFVQGLNDSNESYFSNNSYWASDSSWHRASVGKPAQIAFADGETLFRTSSSAGSGSNITWTESMRISNAGNVGINCAAPEEKLTVDGGVKIANSNKRLYFGTEGGTSYRALEGQVDGSVIQVGESYGVVLLGSASAKVGIRQNSPDAMLHIDGATNSIAGLIIEGSGTGDVIHQQFKAKANNGTLSYHGIIASPGSDQADNTISFGNGAGEGVKVNHQNVVTTKYSEIHSGGTFSYDVGGTYLGANGSGFGTHAIFRTPSVTSPSSGAASTQFLSVYSSGHWGEYALARFRLYTTYFQGGYREYLFRMVAGTCNLEETTLYGSNNSIGAAPGSITKGSVVDTGTDHSGQNIYRVDLTFASTSAYYRNYVVAEINYGANKYYGSANSTSTLDGYTNGGKYHFKTISLAESRGKFVT